MLGMCDYLLAFPASSHQGALVSPQVVTTLDLTNVSCEATSPSVKKCRDRGCLEGVGVWGPGVALAGLIRSCLSESRDFE